MAEKLPDGFVEEEAPPEGFVLEEAPPPGFELEGEQPGILSKAKDLAIKAITPIPALAEANRIVGDKGAELMGASRPDALKADIKDENLVVRAAKEAAVGMRNSTIPIPTPEAAKAAVDMTLPIAPLDLGASLLAAGIPVGKALAEASGLAKVAKATGTNIDSAAAALSRARDEAFGEVTAARKAAEELRTAGASEKQSVALGMADDAVRKAEEKVSAIGREMDSLVTSKKAQLPSIDAGSVAHPAASSPFPIPASAAAAADGIKPEAVSYASKYINLDRLADQSAQEMIAGLSQDPKFQQALMAQKRGVVPLAESKAAGQALGTTVADFAALKPGEMLKKGTLDAQLAAASAMQNMAGKDLAEVASLYAKGAPIEELAGRISMNVEAIVGAQGVISEGGRALGAVRLTAKERALLKVTKSAMREKLLEDPARLRDFLKVVSELPTDAIAQRILAAKKFASRTPGLIDMLQEARGAALLTNPVTMLRNTVGNSMAVMSKMVEEPLAGMADLLTAKVTGTPQQRFIGEGAASSFGAWSGIKSAARDALDILVNERSMKSFGSEFALQQGAIPGKVGQAVRMPFRILDATDTFFKNILASSEYQKLAYRKAAQSGLTGVARAQEIERLLASPTDDMVEGALKAAKQYTFQEKMTGTLAKLEGALNQKDMLGVTAKFFIPFFRTPVNVAKFAIERTPLLSELTERGVFRTAFLKSGATRGEVVDAISRNLVGTAAITASSIALHVNEGLITGAPPKDKAERENLYAAAPGWRPYSIKVGGAYIPYNGFAPASTWLAAVADMAQDIRKNPDADYTARGKKLIESSAKSFLETPFVTGLRDMLEAINNPMGGRVRAIARNAAASTVPSGLAAVARSRDKTLRDPETIVEAMMAKTPWLSERVRPKLSRFGEPVQRTNYMFGLVDEPLPAGNPIENVLHELQIAKAVGFPENSWNGRNMTKDEYNELLTRAGAGIRSDLEQLVTTPQFQAAPPTIQDVPEAIVNANVMMSRTDMVKEIVGNHRRLAGSVVHPKVEMRNLGISDKLSDEELMALNERIETPDYKYLKDNDRRAVVRDFIQEVKRLRR